MTTPAVNGKQATGAQKLESDVLSGEAMVVCPKCKAIQSVFINDGMLMPTRKFQQRGNAIYHDCGSNLPCRIYRDW